jgi:beta-mannosidase
MLPVVARSQIMEKSLNSCSWKFRKVNDKSWYAATVPGTVHTDLLSNKLIPDPFFGDNEKQLQWIENEDWEYKTIFKLSNSECLQSHIELQFDGLDTYAKVYVNDSLVVVADNMFRTWNVDIKKYVRNGKNKLDIVFESAVKKGKEEAKKLSYTLPGDEKVFTRKAQYQYGWDWGPRFVTCGIWKNVKLIFWNQAKIENVKCIQSSLTDSLAVLEFVCQIKSDSNKFYDLEAALNSSEFVKKPLITYFNRSTKMLKGENKVTVIVSVKNPKLWWSNGLGDATIYPFSILLYEINQGVDRHPLDKKEVNVGLRTIELVQDKDSLGSSFYFKLNGVPVFMKGANYIPSDNFLPRITNADYEKVVQNAVDANMNMLRVWGGGVYADDEFYNQCDKKGILVWQDFMFAGAMYPGDNHFIENVAGEVIDQTDRLRNHPSIALWCGNNEVDEGWKNWEWQKQYHYSEKDSTTIAQNNTVLFNDFIKNVVNLHDGSRAYWPSSPSIGWGHKESLLQGDSHYWGVWWGMEPFENYDRKVGRFMSEYGFQGMPDFSTMEKFGILKIDFYTRYQELMQDKHSENDTSFKMENYIDSSSYYNHQKNTAGYKTIQTYMERDYHVPKNFLNYIYVSQLLQAEGMETAIEAHRRAKPYCMGSLFWQLNDCWPVTSWSTIDYYNVWKASQYQVKRSFNDVLVSTDEKNDSISICIVSDKLKSVSGVLSLSVIDFAGNLSMFDEYNIVVPPNSSKVFYKYCIKDITNQYKDVNKKVFAISFKHDNELIKTNYYFVKPKELQLVKGAVNIKENIGIEAQSFTIKSDVFLKDVFISIDGESLNFSDNYFDLLPNETKTIFLPQNIHILDLEKKIKIKSLIDTY